MGNRVKLGTLALVVICTACAGAGTSSAEPAPFPDREAETPLPAGLGSLRQDEITLDVQHESLLIKVTPLAESVIRLTAPDTYQRLRALAKSRATELDRAGLAPDGLLFLVSVFSYDPDVAFEPEDLNILSFGLRFRPRAIVPITPGWTIQRLRQQETQMALYGFEARIDMESSLDVEYRDAVQTEWERILVRLETERARVRARAARRPD